jgi:molecular chaperone GrpE
MPKPEPDEKGQLFQQDLAEDDEIEILEVIGLDEDSPAAGFTVPESEPEPEEIILTIDGDEEEEIPYATRPPDAEAEPAEPVTPPPEPPADLPPEPPTDRAEEAEADVEVGVEGTEAEQLLRLRADFENYKKRVEREMEAQRRRASATLVGRLLQVLDNFERAVSASPQNDSDSTFRDGVVLIFKQLLEELRKEGLTAIDSIGEPFDPNLHEAVATDTQSHFAPNTVVEEMQRGYLLHDRLLRPALVKVRIEPLQDAPRDETEEDA